MEGWLIFGLVLLVIVGIVWTVKRKASKAESRTVPPPLDPAPEPTDPYPGEIERADHPDAKPISSGAGIAHPQPSPTPTGATTAPAGTPCRESLTINGHEVTDGDWFKPLPRTRRLLIAVKTCPLSPEREKHAKGRTDWEGAAAGHGTGALVLEIKKVGPLPRGVARQGSDWAQLSMRKPPAGFWDHEEQNHALVHYHALPWRGEGKGEIAVTVRLDDDADRDYPAELLIAYIPATQIETGQPAINCVIPLGDVTRWTLAGRKPNREVELPSP